VAKPNWKATKEGDEGKSEGAAKVEIDEQEETQEVSIGAQNARKKSQRSLERFSFKATAKVTPRSIAADCLRRYRISTGQERDGGGNAAVAEGTTGEADGAASGNMHNEGPLPRSTVKRWRQSRQHVWGIRRVEREGGGSSARVVIHER
jgi:hypothetical protein